MSAVPLVMKVVVPGHARTTAHGLDRVVPGSTVTAQALPTLIKQLATLSRADMVILFRCLAMLATVVVVLQPARRTNTLPCLHALPFHATATMLRDPTINPVHLVFRKPASLSGPTHTVVSALCAPVHGTVALMIRHAELLALPGTLTLCTRATAPTHTRDLTRGSGHLVSADVVSGIWAVS